MFILLSSILFNSLRVFLWYPPPLIYNCGRIFFILSFFVCYILSFGLVRLRTIRLCAHAGHTLSTVHARACVDVTITNVIIKPQIRYRTGVWMTSWPETMGRKFWRFLKKQWVEIRTWARPVQLWSTRCTVRLLGPWVEIWLWAESSAGELTEGRCRNSQLSKNYVYLSSCRRNSKSKKKVIKRIVPELKKVVSVSRISGFNCIRIFVSWLSTPLEFDRQHVLSDHQDYSQYFVRS